MAACLLLGISGIVVVAVVGIGAYLYWSKADPVGSVNQKGSGDDTESRSTDVPKVPFTDITRQAGITFRHENGAIGRKLLPETMGGGCAFFDYDDDGDQDLLLVNSLNRWPWDRQSGDPPDATMAIYRNDGRAHFTDVTRGSGVDVSFYGMGVAVGDYDGDGREDVFLSAVGPNRLFHNEGNGKFRDTTHEAGVAGDDGQWTTSSGWLDYDNDGDLDLFACNYVDWSREFDESQNFQFVGGGRAYGRPQSYSGSFLLLYRNDGNGHFRNVAAEAGLHVRDPTTGRPLAKSLGVTFADVDVDGWLDIIVANDTVPNFLFHNEQDGTFREIGVPSGVAYDMNGSVRGAMGIDAARLRGGEALGIAIGNFADELTAVYVSYDDQMQFMDEAVPMGVGPTTRMSLTFGLFYIDYDLDGRLDLFAANGHLENDINQVKPNQHYEQSPELFWNSGRQHQSEFLPVTEANSGPDLLRPLVGRGASYADVDADGDLDILITAIGQPPRLLRNDQRLGHHWLRFKLIGGGANRDAIGSRILVELEDGSRMHRQVMPTRSYLSQVELPVTIGLGQSDEVRQVTISWPDGLQQSVEIDGVDRVYEVRQATNMPVNASQ